jgi:hypothetical protein
MPVISAERRKIMLKFIEKGQALQYQDQPLALFICIPQRINDELIPMDRETQEWLRHFHTNYSRGRLLNGFAEAEPDGFTIIGKNPKEPLNKYAFVGKEGLN